MKAFGSEYGLECWVVISVFIVFKHLFDIFNQHIGKGCCTITIVGFIPAALSILLCYFLDLNLQLFEVTSLLS